MRPPLSRLRGGLRIGADFFARRGAIVFREPAPRGVVDSLSDLAQPDCDTSRVHPNITAFFCDTAGLELLIRSHWRFPFSLAWLIFRPFMRILGQFVLPLREGKIDTRAFALDTDRDGRSDARAIVRAYADTGQVMQVVAYATWERNGTRYMSAAFPLPFGHVTGILRLDSIESEDEEKLAVELTSTSKNGDDARVWLVVGALAIPSPFGESISLWAPSMSCAPKEIDPRELEGATILGRHVQKFFGVRFVTHHYWFRPAVDRAPRSKT